MTAFLTSLGLRRRGFRVYLTVVYGGLFLSSGTGLLGLTYYGSRHWRSDLRRDRGIGPGLAWRSRPTIMRV